MQAEDAMPDGEEGQDEDLAVGLADVLGAGWGRPRPAYCILGPFGELHAGLADEADPEAGDL